MNEMVKRRWTALDGCLVFDITINREPLDDVPSCADVSCKSGPSESQTVTITKQWPSQAFDFKFRSGCYVRGYLQQRTPVHIDGITNTAIFADIRYGTKGQGDEHHFEGIMVACPTRGPLPPPGPWPPNPTPIEPDRPADPIEPLPIINSYSEELFPYVYVRRWPQVTAQDLHQGFIQYAGASPPYCTFFSDLVQARNAGRAQAQDLAVRFIDGDSPYQGDFVASVSALAGPLTAFPLVLARLPEPTGEARDWVARACADVAELLASHGLDWSYLESSTYTQGLDRVWQSYFALVTVLGYDTALLVDLTRVLRLAHVIAVALQPNAAIAGMAGQPEPAVALLAPVSIRQIVSLLGATVVLPAQVFPLPPSPRGGDSPPSGAMGWMEPYAIGDLQMVRQRLLRYQGGEIARIENVMRGERREVTHKRTQRQVDTQKQTTAEMQILQNDAADERSNLQEESRKTIAEATETNQYNKFTSSYGPPTQATLDGSWSKAVQQGAQPGLDDTTRFARDILNKTVSRISRSVSQTRSSSTMSQTEDVVVSLIDNAAGIGNVRAVYRWLNKVYEACVVNYGQRLMMEFLVRRPAARFIAHEQALAGQDFIRPLPPTHFGVVTFEDIKVDGPRNYAQLGAYYGVLDIEPPPLAQRYASATVRGGEEKLLAIPAGYGAVQAYVTVAGAAGTQAAPIVLVGRQTVGAGAASSPVSMNGEDDTVPVSVAEGPPSLSPPGGDSQVVVNVEIRCAPTPRCMDQWRINTYARVMRAFQERLAAYQARADGGTHARLATRSPLANRRIEQRELKNACLRLLLERWMDLTGAGDAPAQSPPSEFVVNEPRYLQFLDEALEWGEMAYSFQSSPAWGMAGPMPESSDLVADDDALFVNFLQADQARVLLPVQPAHVMAFLYFYSAGALWIAPDQQAPVNSGDIALVNDLKHFIAQPQPATPVGPRWEVLVPTAMQVLDGVDTGPGTRAVVLGGAAP